MTPAQMAQLASRLEHEAATLRETLRIIGYHESQQAKATLPRKLRQAARLRDDSTPVPNRNGAPRVREVAMQLAATHQPITNKAIRAAGVSLTISGVSSALLRAGYVFRRRQKVWTPPKQAKASAPKVPRNGPPSKGDKARVLAAIVKEAGQAMRFGELQASAAKVGVRATPQTFGAAVRYGWLKAEGDAFALGPRGAE